MPFQSEEQRKAMYAAASGHSNLGISSEVAKRFIRHSKKDADTGARKDDAALPHCARILFVTPQGKVLLIHQGSLWGIPGGHMEEGESEEACAKREVLEETGFKYKGDLKFLLDDGLNSIYCAYVAEEFTPDTTKNPDSEEKISGFVWTFAADAPPEVYGNVSNAFRVMAAITETDVAELMREQIIPSPQIFANMLLVALRITGTGMAYRTGLDEHVWRDPQLYLNDDFLKRCNGLTVVLDHPDTGPGMNSDEFKKHVCGSIMMPYLLGDEVWGIAKIYDENAIEIILTEEVSTSPSVVFDKSSGNTTLATESGDKLLIEGKPFLLDHLAIVTKKAGARGVWDKGGLSSPIQLTNIEAITMSDKDLNPVLEAVAKLTASVEAVNTNLGGISTRMDAMEQNLPAASLKAANDAAQARKDAEDKMAKEKADADEKEMKEKADAEEKAKKDADDKKAADDKAKKDAAGGTISGVGEMRPDADETPEEKKAREDADKEAAKNDSAAAEYADCQARADSVYSAFAKRASRALPGESLLAYRQRLLRGLQAYSDSYKEVNLASIKDIKLLDLAEKQIFNDALMTSRTSIGSGTELVEVIETDRGGRRISKFRGPISGWLDTFKTPSLRVVQFNTQNNRQQ